MPMDSSSVGSLAGFYRRAHGHRGVNESNENYDIRSMQAQGAEWINSRFVGCKMGLSDLRGSRFIETTLQDCTAYASNFSGATIQSCDFSRTDFEQAAFIGAIVKDACFDTCRFSYSSFAGAMLRGKVRFKSCEFRGADLDFIESDSVEFDGCNLWGARVNLGCSFWNSHFDRRTMQMFASLLARIDPDDHLIAYAGDRLPVVKRLMDSRDE